MKLITRDFVKPLLYCILILIVGCKNRNEVITGKEGQKLPSMLIQLVDNKTVTDINSVPTGNPIILFYISPHCPFCKAQMKDMVDHIESLKNTKIYIISSYPIDEIRKFQETYNIQSYKNITIGRDFDQTFKNYFKSNGVPYTAIFDRKKNLNKVFAGSLNSTTIKKYIQ
jgi:peroxiredoxin